jgi:hypothetical protein
MRTPIRVSDKLAFPVDLVTQVEVILAKRRAGKSYTMRRIVEQLLKAHQQVVMVDPKGDQWGLRSSADGKKPGFPVLILGGEHGDIPLEASGGEVVAKLVVEQRVSVLLDLSLFRKSEVARFMTDFMENLYRLKAQEKYRTPVKLVVDEADAIAPQKPQMDETRMLGAIEDIVRRGGQRGIGCTLVSQRSAVLNKNVLTQAQVLVVLRTIAPQDLDAIKAWVDVHGTKEEGKELMESLPSLPIGDAWFWSPGWPTEEGIFKRVHVSPIETFDSGATPKPGQKRIIPKNLADVDLKALQGQMAATIEKAKQDDPKALRAEINRLKGELAKAKPPAPVVMKGIPEVQAQRMVAIALAKRDKEWEVIMRKWSDYAREFRGAVGAILAVNLERIVKMEIPSQKPENKPTMDGKTYGDGENIITKAHPTFSPKAVADAKKMPEKAQVAETAYIEGAEVAGKAHDLLKALSGYFPGTLTRAQAATIAKIKVSTSTFRNCISKLKVRGFLETEGDFGLRATQAGMDYLGADVAPPDSPEEVRERWRKQFGGYLLAAFDYLVSLRGAFVDRNDLAAQIGVDPGVSTFRNVLSKLRVNGLIVEESSGIAASPTLF